MAVVRLEGVSKRFDGALAVDDVSFEARDGEFLSLLGPSGCGKTTTLRMIAGLDTPTEGRIYVDDVLVNDLPPSDRDIAFVFQFYVMYPGMKVFDQIAFPLRMLKEPQDEIRRRVKDVAATLGLMEALDAPVSRTTIEQRQKIELGRAMVRRPKVYLFDEPLSNLDAAVRTRMRVELKRLQKELGATTLYVTHDQLEAITMADRVAVMNNGRVQQLDTPDRLYEYPRNLFVAGFIGTPPMNFIKCDLVQRQSRVVLDAHDFTYDITRFAEHLAKRTSSGKVILGIRPEYVSVDPERVSEHAIECVVDVVEPFGYRIIVNLRVGHHLLKGNIRHSNFRMGDKAWALFDPERIRIFDQKAEEMLL